MATTAPPTGPHCPIKITLALIFFQNCLFPAIAQNAPPEIELAWVGENWHNFSIPTTHKLVLHSEKGDDLNLECRAPYPIQWNFTGYLSPPEVAKIQPPRRNLAEKSYLIAVNIFFEDAQEFAELGASVRVACEKIGSSQIKDELYLFVRGNQNNPLVPPEVTTVEDSKLIPCPTKDPTRTPTLHRRLANGNEELVRGPTVRYHLIEGFRSNSEFNGNYLCKLGSSSVSITALVTSQGPSDDFQFTPKSSSVRVFSEEAIQFECFSKSFQPVRLIIDAKDNRSLTVFHRIFNGRWIAQVSSRLDNANETLPGKAFCVDNADRLIKQWTFEFVPTPTLFLDNFEGEVDCLSLVTPRMVQTVRCKNRMDCNFMAHCLENVTRCNFKKQKQFFANKDTFCWLEKIQQGTDCASVPYSHLNGLAQCTVAGLKKQWDYFVSLDFLKYSNWQEAPETELLRMDEVPPILYTNRTTHFFCMAVAYLFADSLSFEMEFKNGSRILLEDNGKGANVSNPGQENTRKIDEFNVIGILSINLPLEATGIWCCAPWWNGTDGLKTARKFETRHLLTPKLIGESAGPTKTEAFYTGQENRRLICSAKGEPQPEYTWYFKDKKVSEILPKLKTSLGSNGEGYLEFPGIGGGGENGDGKQYAGEYRCTAENMVGSVERRFLVDVSDEPISASSVGYIVTVVLILLVLAFVLVMLYVFMKRYNEAKALVRSLTDSEIEEFFKGKPELLNNSGGNNFDIVDFLPYKSEYEIPLEDLAFDNTEKNLLGTGEFAYVVRAMIISKSRPVALKISKPSADVSLFKSLLSEVKIMIYIGQHENVVALVGVSTQSIRERSIHIATDICDLGSLDGFLRKARPSFVNLINANQQIDMSLLPATPSSKQVTTLDLISFCAQIAKGMEYLANKSVVHADLAGRNVLLTADRVAKISDFGLSKKLYECNNYVKKSRTPLPWRWMAIESLTTLTFSTSSDIWAYGVTLFEVFTLGDIPFPSDEWNKEFVTRLASGMRMGRPKYSTQEIYSKVVACWENELELRPSFTALRVYFEQLLQKYSNVASGGTGGGNNGANDNGHDTGYDHSGPLTTTGASLYVNYDQNENLGIGPGISNALPLNYVELNHDHGNHQETSGIQNNAMYMNVPNEDNFGGKSIELENVNKPVLYANVE